MATMLEQCNIFPFPVPDRELSLPPTHFDIPFLQSDPTQRLLFFDTPCSKSQFLETIVPRLKKSLALVLHHFLPLAGNIILDSERPLIRYAFGDSVSLTVSVARSNKDFDYLTRNHQRVAEEFYAIVPKLPPATRSLNSVIIIPVMSLQITLYPQQGICIGLTNSHAIADESSIVNFVKAWASVNKSGSDVQQTLLDKNLLPFFDRTAVQNPEGLDSVAWELVKKTRPFPVEHSHQPLSLPLDKMRFTFILKKSDVQRLKRHVKSKCPDLIHVSDFTVISAYVWTCSERSSFAVGEKVNNNEPVYFSFAADCRSRLNPQLPSAYFGNCLVFVVAESTYGELIKGHEGFIIAAGSIGEAFRTSLYSKQPILESVDWPVDFGRFRGKRVMSVAGSPRLGVYGGTDYGWGMPSKYEFVHINTERSMSLCESREFEGGFEIGLSRTKIEMAAFEHIFTTGLDEI